MAKKNLINADMLLATPRKAVEQTPVPSAPEVVHSDSKPVAETPTVAYIPTPVITIPEPPVMVPIPKTIVEETPPMPVASVKRGLKGNETRATFIVDENLLEKLKAIAYWDRLNIKDVINDTFQSCIDAHESKNGEIKPIPNNRKA